MHRLTQALLATAVLGGVLAAAPPAIAAPDPFGVLCGFTVVSDPTTEESVLVGEIDGGPVVVADTGVPAAGATLLCTIRVNGSVVAAAVGHDTGAVSASPRTVSYVADPGADVQLCTKVAYDSGPTLYYDDARDEWSADPGAPCEDAVQVSLPDSGRRADDTPRAQSGGHKRKQRSGTDPLPTQPYYPSGTIEISSNGSGVISYTYTGFTPSVASWSCPPPTGTSVTCTPPAPPLGYDSNVCRTVTVAATSSAPGTVTGTSTCAQPPAATATSNGPTTTPATASATPYGAFPWTCAAAPEATTIWTVRCTVG